MPKQIVETSDLYVDRIKVSELVDRWGADAWVYADFDGRMVVEWTREETKAEETRRLAKAQREREKREAKRLKDEERERREYERLKEKFG
jgi:hypothetical protein